MNNSISDFKKLVKESSKDWKKNQERFSERITETGIGQQLQFTVYRELFAENFGWVENGANLGCPEGRRSLHLEYTVRLLHE